LRRLPEFTAPDSLDDLADASGAAGEDRRAAFAARRDVVLADWHLDEPADQRLRPHAADRRDQRRSACVEVGAGYLAHSNAYSRIAEHRAVADTDEHESIDAGVLQRQRLPQQHRQSRDESRRRFVADEIGNGDHACEGSNIMMCYCSPSDGLPAEDCCTLVAVSIAAYAVVAAFEGDIPRASAAVLFTWVFDALDGAVARLTGGGTDFGARFDDVVDHGGTASPLASSSSPPFATIRGRSDSRCAFT
jgi:hypothetical protein